jgi:hypothetical protein
MRGRHGGPARRMPLTENAEPPYEVRPLGDAELEHVGRREHRMLLKTTVRPSLPYVTVTHSADSAEDFVVGCTMQGVVEGLALWKRAGTAQVPP